MKKQLYTIFLLLLIVILTSCKDYRKELSFETNTDQMKPIVDCVDCQIESTKMNLDCPSKKEGLITNFVSASNKLYVNPTSFDQWRNGEDCTLMVSTYDASGDGQGAYLFYFDLDEDELQTEKLIFNESNRAWGQVNIAVE